MEDDDEFGDLYTDVLQNFPSSGASETQKSSVAPTSVQHPIDLNFPVEDDRENPISNPISSTSPSSENIVSDQDKLDAEGQGEYQNLGKVGERNLIERGGSRVLEIGNGNSRDGYVKDSDFNSNNNSNTDLFRLGVGGGSSKEKEGDFVNRSADFNVEEDEKSMKFDVEEAEDGAGGMGADQSIPGLSRNEDNVNDATGEGDEWDSDSDDDLQIVLNDNNHGRHMGMERGGVMGGDEDDDDDEDGEPLVIVADGDDPNRHQGMEEQEWGEDGTQAADGERKEMGEAGKANGGMVIAPKIGYSNQGFHPFHSQFKYVRPGAAPIPGAAAIVSGGAPGQVRPPVNMGPMGGRGRGDWRPPGMKIAPTMQKNFHSGFGGPAWGNSGVGRGFGSGLEFTLPSHKTIFEVDIDSFEEKPWKHSSVDITDFFNFGLNEDSWKDYCKQLERLRLESTMQSNIRVYESGRAEQEYDPDMPPELAAAAGMNDISTENLDIGKADANQIDLTKGSMRVRPPLPSGRAIQVETGYGDRLPSMDTRPPRMRDADAVIEIVCQDSGEDESSSGEGVSEQPENDPSGKDLGGSHKGDEKPVEAEYHDDLPHTYTGRKRETNGSRAQLMNSLPDDLSEKDGISPSLGHPGYRAREERCKQGGTNDRSPHSTPTRSSRDEKLIDNQKEKSIESMGGKHSPLSSSPAADGAARDLSVEKIDAIVDELVMADESSEMEGEELHSQVIETVSAGEQDHLVHPKKQKLGSRLQQSQVQKVDNMEDFKAGRSSDNGKVRSGSSRDYQNLHDDVEEEVIQDGRTTRRRNMKKYPDEDEQMLPKRDCDGRLEIERNRFVQKGREDSYPYRDWEPSLSYHTRIRNEGYDRRKERENSDGFWQPRDDDPHGRRIRIEDSRKRERVDEMGSRHWGNVRESDRIDRDEHVYLRKPLDNGSRRSHYEKGVGSRHREKDDSLKTWHENADDYRGKRRKDDEHIRRDHAEKEELLHGQRESSSVRKRERGDVLDQRKRDDQQRIRDNIDDHHSLRKKEDVWLPRERAETHKERAEIHRERDDRQRFKQTHEEVLTKREKEGREAVRSGRGTEDKSWASQVKDERKGSDKDYPPKDTGRLGELKRRDRVEDRGRDDKYTHGNQLTSEEKRSRHERSSSRNDRVSNASDNQKVHDRKSKENTRKNKESKDFDHSALGTSKRNQDGSSSYRNEMVGLNSISEQGKNTHNAVVQPDASRKHKEDASSDDEHQDSRRGRSKLERWASQKETDFIPNSKSSSSSKVKEIGRSNSSRSSLATKVAENSAKPVEAVDIKPLVDNKNPPELENKDGDSNPTDDRHLDTVAKLKKRSERFKLPMPSEKDTLTIKKVESDALPSSQSETPATEAEVKPERPPRKRRWVSNQN